MDNIIFSEHSFYFFFDYVVRGLGLGNIIHDSAQVVPKALLFYLLIILPVIFISRQLFKPQLFILLSFISILVFPALSHSHGGRNLAFGLIFSSLIIFSSFFSYTGIKKINSLVPRNFVLFTIALFLIIFLHSSFVFFFQSDTYDLSRLIISAAGLFTIIASAYIFTYTFSKVGSDEVAKIMKSIWYFIIFLTILVLIKFAIFSPFYNNGARSLILFEEPSFFVLACLPFFLFKLIVSNSFMRLLLLLLLICLAIALRSTTLLIGVGFCFLLLYSSIITKKTLFYWFLFLVTLLLIYITFFHSHLSDLNPIRYMFNRIFDFFKPVSIETNMSSLSLLKDWHEAFMNSLNTKGLGIGFQQTGIHGFQSYISGLIYLQTHHHMTGVGAWNIRFESFTIAPKLISEFGILGILAICFYLRYFIDSFVYLSKSVSNKITSSCYLDILFHSIYILFFISLFVRGTGYFSVSTLFFFSSVIYLFFLKSNK